MTARKITTPLACERQHTPAPAGYLEWHGWAERKSKTHRQKRCPGCLLWAIWVPRSTRDDASGQTVDGAKLTPSRIGAFIVKAAESRRVAIPARQGQRPSVAVTESDRLLVRALLARRSA